MDSIMWRDRQGVMRGSPALLSCILVVGWTMVSSQMMSPAMSGQHPSKEDADIPDDSVCNLHPNDIETSGKHLLKQLSQCPSITPDQASAIRDVLRNGDTPFGPPSEWSASTLEELEGLIHHFDRSILKLIPKSVLSLWMKDSLPREQLAAMVGNLNSSRKKRATECPPDKKLTEKVIKEVTMPIDYSPEEVHACFKGSALVDNLGILTNYAFTYEQQREIKYNLDEMFPEGYPESVIRNLGGLVNLVNLDDVKKWNFTSPETLDSLMDQMKDEKLAPEIIKRYISSGGALNSDALNAIGSRICILNQDKLNQIPDVALKGVKSLDISKCNQTTKDILYSKAKRAFSDQENNFPLYYDLIKPYLGGAPLEDLRALSSHNVDMDIQTFMNLKKDSVMGLTTDEVKYLLGKNLKDLTKQQDNFPIKDWIRKQMQSDLNKLGIGRLRGGIPEGYMNIRTRQ